MMPFWPISDTALAACLGTLDIEFDPGRPYSHSIDTGTGKECMFFWLRDRSQSDEKCMTEYIVGAWKNREKFEREFPNHPLVAMRAALDARSFFLGVIHGNLPTPPKYLGGKHQVHLLRDAAILHAHGFPLLLFTGRQFSFPVVWNHQSAEQILDQAQKKEGRSPAQWMHKVLINFDNLLVIAKNADKRLLTREDNKTLDLSADAPKAIRDQFFDKFAEDES